MPKKKTNMNNTGAVSQRKPFVPNKTAVTKVTIPEIQDVQQYYWEENKTEFIPANIRSVLFCGASRSGKTTAYKVFMDPCYCPEKSSMFSETQDTTFKTFCIRDNKTKQVKDFIVNLIDSPGTFEIRAADSEFETRSNEKIGEIIINCLNHEVTYLNMVAMFLTISGRVGDRDIESIELFMNMFGGCGMPVILVVTHADEFNDTKREEILHEIKLHPSLKRFFDHEQLEVFFMGCVDYIRRDFVSQDAVSELYANVTSWRETLLEKISSSEKRIELKETAIFKNKHQNLKEMLGICLEEMNALETLDKDGQQYKARQRTHSANMEYLYKNKMILDQAEEEEKAENSEEEEPDSKKAEEAIIFAKFWEKIQQIRQADVTKIPAAVKAELINPWLVDSF